MIDITTLITLIISLIAIAFSAYNFYQSIRKMEVNLWIDEEDTPFITIYAFNPGQHPVPLINFKYCINKKTSNIREGTHESDPAKYDGASSYVTSFNKDFDFPYILKGGEAIFITHKATNLAGTLLYKGYTGKIKLSAYFVTVQKKIYKSKSTIDFDIEKYRIKKGIEEKKS